MFGKFIAYAALAASLGSALRAEEGHSVGLKEITVGAGSARSFDGYVWYPTAKAEGAVAAHGNAVWEGIKVHPDAEVAEGRYPLLMLSHGMFGNARNQAWLAENMVSRGYVVVAVNHPGTTTFMRDADQRRMLWERPKDISRAIDHILSGDLASVVDDGQIFMAGHSLGGFTAMLLAGARFDADKLDAGCAKDANTLICTIFGAWSVAKTPEDRAAMQADLSDGRIKAFGVFDLGGTQSFSADSLGSVSTPLIVYGAPRDIHGLDLDVESRALMAALPEGVADYHEPERLSHFDFLGVCTERGLAILKDEEPEDAFICQEGREERRAEHAEIAQQVAVFLAAQ